MALILQIDTATSVCSVALSKDEELLGVRESFEKNAHSSLITLFIDELIKENSFTYADLDAVAVSMGPGSYTGLRIGVATAKGICYAIDKPLIAVSTLKAMANGVLHEMKNKIIENKVILCPMIDARRMEVYNALFDRDLHEIREIKAEIIDEHSFADQLDHNILYFFGDGAEKCKQILTHPNACFLDNVYPLAKFMVPLTYQKFSAGQFEDLAYFEPVYLKDFIAGIPRVKGLR